jgi:hypothetical protein
MSSTDLRSRRALLLVGLGSVVAAVSATVGNSVPVSAVHDAEDVELGQSSPSAGHNQSPTTTRIDVSTASYSAFWGANPASGNSDGVGVRGDVWAAGTNERRPAAGVWGQSNVDASNTKAVGVLGTTRSHSVQSVAVLGVLDPASSLAFGTAVKGICSGPGIGVWGTTTGGEGVKGTARADGVAVVAHATGPGGIALHSSGRTVFTETAGVAAIAPGATSVTITPSVDVRDASFVLLTPRGNIGSRGLWYTIDATNNRFTIHISSKYSDSSSLKVAWMLAES